MYFSSSILALAASVTAVSAQIKGFNYGNTFTTGAPKQQQDFVNEFNTAKALVGAPGFTAARLYTTIQAGTANTPISAIPAAISTQTQLLLGLWASAGQANFDNEVAALTAAIQQYGSAFTDLIVGISVGSEDLYRISPTGIINKSGAGANPQDLVNYINQVRNAIRNTPAASKPITHVDTWTAFQNASNSAVISAIDVLGFDGYPYFQNTQANSIDNAEELFWESYNITVGVSQGKPVWITETGWPVSGPTENQAVANPANAKAYWDRVGCSLFGKINTFWYTLQDASPDTPSPSFGIVGNPLTTTPIFDLTCPAGSNGNTAASSSVATSATSVAAPSAPASTASGASSVGAGSGATPVPGPGYASSVAPSAAASSPAAPASSPAASAPAGSSPAPSAPAASSAGSAPAPVSQISDGQVQASSAAPAGSSKPADSGKPAVSTASPVLTTQTTTIYTTPTNCPTTLVTITSTKMVSASSAAAQSSGAGQPSVPASSAAPSKPAQPSSSSCPANLSGAYEFPHLIVPVDKSAPNKAYGTSYNGQISSSVSSIFNFDIPASTAGKTCTLVFLFPTQAQLETSSFTLKGSGGITVSKLNSAATEQTTYSNAPVGQQVGSVASVTPGNSYVVASGPCPSGDRISYRADATGSLDLTYFQDYNPSPIGMYITVC